MTRTPPNHFKVLFLSALLAFMLSPCASFSQTADPLFSEAVSSFKDGKLADARDNFLELEKEHPFDPTLLLNLGIIAQKEARLGAALALWRKALAENPTNEALLSAVDWTKPKLPKSAIAHETEAWEEFRRAILIRVSPLAVTVAAALFLLLSGWRLLRWWAARRRALELETAMPAVPFGGFFLSFVFIIFLGISIAGFVDRLDIRGTILSAKVAVRSAPDQTATELFEVFEGMEVIVRDSRSIDEKLWRRITYPGGMTGWVRERDVLTWNDPSARVWEK